MKLRKFVFKPKPIGWAFWILGAVLFFVSAPLWSSVISALVAFIFTEFELEIS